ncbi:zinc ribbon domain-containing protein [Salegentibacter chungangensis]|uniref:Zinc ribbon domain-containing protein n=1 Tax=Salegentibacter chungangensis TaxID=1335724 RepID=A0ABW3NT86_9FLAO
MITEVCQSCGFPLIEANRGHNRDLSLSNDYCRNCFDNGEFKDHSLSLHQLEVDLLERAEKHNEISLEEAQDIIKILPHLKRWRMSNF